MTVEQLEPYVRFFSKVNGMNVYNRMLCAFDFRLFYIVKGQAEFTFKNEKYRLSAGDLITISPGTPYKVQSNKSENVEYFLLNFDFTFENKFKSARIPVYERDFDASEIFSNECISMFDDVFVMRRCNGIEALLEEMVQYDIVRDLNQALLRSAIMKAVIMKIILKHSAGNGGEEKLVKEVKKYIDRHSAQPLTNMQIAKRFGYHPYYLGNVFLSEEGMTLHKYIMDSRVKNAKEKLSFTEKPISVIASEMGFRDSSYFSAFFKKVAGMTPKEYRKLCR